MTDTQLKVLTQTTSIPGKVYYAGIFCLDSYDRITNPLRTPTKRIKLSQPMDVLSPCVSKRRKLNNDTPDDPKLELEFEYENSDSTLTPVDPEDVDPMEEEALDGEPAAKAVKSDDAKPPIALWNNRVVTKLREHWDALPEDTDPSGLRSLDLTSGSEDRVKFDRWLDVIRFMMITK